METSNTVVPEGDQTRFLVSLKNTLLFIYVWKSSLAVSQQFVFAARRLSECFKVTLLLFCLRVVGQIIFFFVVYNLFSFSFWGFIFFMNSSWVFFCILSLYFINLLWSYCWPCFCAFSHTALNFSSPPQGLSLLFPFHSFLSLLQEYLRAPVTSTFAGFRSMCSAATWSSARGRTAAGLWTCRWSRLTSPDTSPTESGTSWVRAHELLQKNHEAEMLFFLIW